MHWEIPTRTLGLVIVQERAETRERKKKGAIRVKARAAGTRALPYPHFSGTLWGLQASPPLP